jgi:hypothetical protein
MHVFSLLKGDIKVHYIQSLGNLPNPKKISTIVNMPPLKFPKDIQIFNGMGVQSY